MMHSGCVFSVKLYLNFVAAFGFFPSEKVCMCVLINESKSIFITTCAVVSKQREGGGISRVVNNGRKVSTV